MSVIPTQKQTDSLEKECAQTWAHLQITPRKWQADALPVAMSAIWEQWTAPMGSEEVLRPLVQAVMGAGKSIFISGVVGTALQHTKDTIVVTAPRKMLVKQLATTLEGFLPLGSVGRYYGKVKQPGRRVIVACDASTHRLAKSLRSAGRKVALWVADECHGSESNRMKSWETAAAPHARLGMTATPRRAKDDEALSLWTKEVYRYDAAQAMRDGVVVPFVLRHWHGPNCELDDAILTMLKDIVLEKIGPGVVDAANIADAEAFRSRLESEGIKAATVHSELQDAQIQRRLDRLRDGEIDVVVHVSMLKEGVDMPWLRWMGLRRQVESKVHFAQHVGRALRAHPGKKEAIILDPGHLFERHSINLTAILELEVDEEPHDELAIPRAERSNEHGLSSALVEEAKEKIYAVPMTADISALQSLFVAMETQGRVARGSSGMWRMESISDRQLEAIHAAVRRENTKAALQNHPQADMFRRMYAQRHDMKKGIASDYISILFGLTKPPMDRSIIPNTNRQSA